MAVSMRPILPLLGDAQRLFISPDGALNLVPFAALQDPTGRYVVESHEISYLTTGRDLLRLQERAKESGRALIVANPEFGIVACRGAPAGNQPAGRERSICHARASPRFPAPRLKRPRSAR